ncbi:MAG TPA: alpha/beta hydrolase, partial [Candidatus Limnocylindrales bacterium]|nr:alpha/beta hydrolase [Candidatus Limnocylindrales bacterium]
PLAWLTTHVFLQPRGHTVRDVSAARAIERYRGPVLLIQGDHDRVVPVSHLGTLERAARKARGGQPGTGSGEVEVLVIPGGEHSWLYEFSAYRGAIGRFLANHLGPLDPDEAERIARAVPATRLPQREHPFSAIEPQQGGVSLLVQAIKAAGDNRIDRADDAAAAAPAPAAAPASAKGG